MFEPGLLLRKEIVFTSIGEIPVEELTFLKEYEYFLRYLETDLATQVSFLTGVGKFRIEALTEEERKELLYASRRVNSPIKLPNPGGKSKKVSFFDCLLFLCNAGAGSLKELITSFSRQQIHEFAYALQDKNIRFSADSSDPFSKSALEAAAASTKPMRL